MCWCAVKNLHNHSLTPFPSPFVIHIRTQIHTSFFFLLDLLFLYISHQKWVFKNYGICRRIGESRLRWNHNIPEMLRCTPSACKWLEPRTLGWCRQYLTARPMQFCCCLVNPAVVVCQTQATLEVRGTCSVQKLADNDSCRAIVKHLFCKHKQVMHYSCWRPV